MKDLDKFKEEIVQTLKTCYDPEIPVNIYDLGLVYGIEADEDGSVAIRMTLTSPACPIAGALVNDVKTKVEAMPDVKECTVELVWDPPWNLSMVSEEGKIQLGME